MTSGPKDILEIKDGAAWLASALIINFLIWSNLFQRSGEALSATNLVLPLMISAVAFCLWRAKRQVREEGTWLLVVFTIAALAEHPFALLLIAVGWVGVAVMVSYSVGVAVWWRFGREPPLKPKGEWDPSVHRLPVWATIREAVQAIAKEWKALLKVVAVPTLAFVALGLVPSPPAYLGWLLLPLLVGLPTMIAVSCHRLVILGADSLPNAWGLYWWGRETRFLGWMWVLSILVGLARSLPESLFGEGFTQNVFSWVYVPLGLYLTARLSLVLPATAIGQRRALAHSWQLTRSNGLRLALVLSPAVLLVFLPIVLITALNDSSVVAAADYFLRQSLAFTMLLLLVFGFALLSKAYSWFAGEIEAKSPS